MKPDFRIFFFFFLYKIAYGIHPDSFLPIEDLTRKYGYSIEMHEVTTKDGYILEIFRLFPQGEKNRLKFKKPVLMAHGLGGQSENFIINGMNNGSLAYFLADNGYDIWLGNSRGTQHGRKHLTLTPNDNEFWNFSYHEIAIYDLPATIDYILEKSDSEKISYIGHSQGGTIFFVLCSVLPEYQDKIKFASLLAPTGTRRKNQKTLFSAMSHLYKEIEPFLKLLNVRLYEIPPTNLFDLSDLLLKICKGNSRNICVEAVLIYENSGEFNDNLIPIGLRFVPSISFKQFVHYAQNVLTAHFRPFDYGTEENMIIYGKTLPNDYPIENINVPIAMYYSLEDNFAFYKDVEDMCSIVKNCVRKFIMENKKWTHIDFIYSENLKNALLKPLVKFAQENEL